jgi:hypothetical protein
LQVFLSFVHFFTCIHVELEIIRYFSKNSQLKCSLFNHARWTMQFVSLKRKKRENEFIFYFYFKMQSNSLLIPENQSRFKRNVLFLNVFLRGSRATLKTTFLMESMQRTYL